MLENRGNGQQTITEAMLVRSMIVCLSKSLAFIAMYVYREPHMLFFP